jgi:hypothetical protein
VASAAFLDKAARLATLAERIAKLHAQVGRDVMAARSRRALPESLAQFERALREVSEGVPAEARENYRLLRHLWDEYRVAASQPATREGARKLAERTEEVVWIAEKGVRLVGPPAGSEALLAAASARTAAQRIAKLHLLRGWALPADASARELRAAEATVALALARLKSEPNASEDATMVVRMADDQFSLMRQAIARLEGGGERALQLEHIAKTADHIMESMDRVARLD